jgi:glucan-binding YG repeat protein
VNKKVKKIIAFVLAFGMISAAAPSAKTNLLTTKVYAATNDDKELSSLKLETESNNNIRLYENDDYDGKVNSNDVSEGDTYYAKTSSSKVKLAIEGVKSKYVKVFTSTSSSAKGKDLNDEISLSGDKTITLKIYDEDVSDETVRFDEDSSNYNEIGDYTIEVKYDQNASESDSSDNYDDIYLEKLSVDGQDIELDDSKVLYNYNVANNVSKVTIKAIPDDEDADNDYTVTIDGTDVTSDNYKKTVDLKNGTNDIKVRLEYEDDSDDDYEREYTINIYRATPTVEAKVEKLTDQWVPINGSWKRNDSQGNPYKNTWFFDRTYNKWYYFGPDGYMKTGWTTYQGKYYYLYPDGSMALNTTIGVYRLDGSGAWVG